MAVFTATGFPVQNWKSFPPPPRHEDVRCIRGDLLFTAHAGALALNISALKSRPEEPGFPAKKIDLFQAFEKAFTSG
jgi:hypothetical protein